MSKEVKKLMIDSLTHTFKDVKECVVIDISTLDSEANFSFREDMRAAAINVQGVKNSLVKKALEGSEIQGISEVLKGSCAISYTDADSVTLAKALVGWAKENENLVIKGGFTEGKLLDDKDVKALSKMPSRDELLSIISGQIMGPASQLASQLRAPGAAIAGAVKAHMENNE
jgi:large subunit ribosomal protein L10